jgi:Domain of unknown function (DUF4276)
MVRVFVEGGGVDNAALKTECRRAFAQLFEKAGLEGRMPRTIVCGPRTDAFEQFSTALEEEGAADASVLLVDAEAPVTHVSPWEHVRQRQGDGWQKPAGASDDHLHLMVECMESWFLADPEALAAFYGQGFNENALPKSAPEQVAKTDVYSALDRATRPTKTKGRYGKGTHSFKLLATLDPAKVCAACPAAKRFFDAVDRLTR